MQYELTRRIERVTGPDHIRDYVFEQAYLFAKHDAEYVNWDILEEGSPIHDVHAYFKDLKEYIKLHRPDNINRLQVAELNFECEPTENNEQDLNELLSDIENEDNYHLMTIISLRKYIDYAS